MHLGPLPGSRRFREKEACLLPEVRFGCGEPWAASCPHSSSGITAGRSQGPRGPPTRHPTRTPAGLSAAWMGSGWAAVGSGEGSPEGRWKFPGQCPDCQLLPQVPRVISGKARHPVMPASRRGSRPSWSPGMRRGQVAQRRGPGLPGTSSACVIMPSEGRCRSPGRASVSG